MHLSVHHHPHESVFAGSLEEVAELAFAPAHEGGEDLDARSVLELQELLDDLGRALAPDGLAALGAVGCPDARPEKAEVIVDLGNGANGRAWIAAHCLLFDRDGRGEPLDRVDVGLFHEPEELTSVRGEGLYVAPLAFSVDRVEREGGFAGSGEAGDDDQALPRELDVDVPEVVLSGAADDQFVSSHSLVR